jgi:hypothetical protein
MNGTAVRKWEDGVARWVEHPLPKRLVGWKNGISGGDWSECAEGVIVGWRTVTDGEVIYETEDPDGWFPGPPTATRTWAVISGSAQRVWIVSFDLRRKPVKCFDHQLSTMEES